MAADTLDLEVPSALIAGRYRLIRIIGRGGMGTVYEAENTSIGRRVALKLLDAAYARDEVLRKRFEREARTATAISHPHVVEMLDRGIADPDSPFIVMELLQGESLRERMMREQSLPTVEACHIAAQVLSALALAHSRGVVHRDLKPDNVFLVARAGDLNFVKLLDFGISKFRGENSGELNLTSTGAVMGTPRYMSPEQARGQHDLDHRVDLFATGVLLYEMLAGRPPHSGENYNALVASLIEQPSPPLAGYVPECPPELCAMVDRALLRDRDLRPSVSEFLAVLRKQLPAELLTPTLQQLPPEPMPPAAVNVRTPVRDPSHPSGPRLPPAHSSAPGSPAGPDARTIAMRGSSSPGHASAPPSQIIVGRDASQVRIGDGVLASTDPAHPTVPSATWKRYAALSAGLGIVGVGALLLLGRPVAPTGPSGPAVVEAVVYPPGTKPLRFGMVRYLPHDTMRRDTSPLAEYLKSQLHVPVEEVPLEDYEQVQAKILAGKVDLVTMNPLTYVKVKERIRELEPLATIINDGSTTYQGIIVTRMGSGLQSLDSLKGKIMCWVNATSASGYLFPRALFRKQRLDPDRMFRTSIMTGDHLSSLRALRDGACDAAAVFATALFNARDEGISPGAFQVIGTTDVIPLDALVARPDLPKAERERIRAVLLAASPGSKAARELRSSFSKIDGFGTVRDSDYDAVRQADRAERASRSEK